MLECWSRCMYVAGSWQCLQQVGCRPPCCPVWQPLLATGRPLYKCGEQQHHHPPTSKPLKITHSSYPGSSQYPGWDILCRIRESKACKRQVTGSTRAFRDFSKIPNGGTLCWPPNYTSRQWPRPKYY